MKYQIYKSDVGYFSVHRVKNNYFIEGIKVNGINNYFGYPFADFKSAIHYLQTKNAKFVKCITVD